MFSCFEGFVYRDGLRRAGMGWVGLARGGGQVLEAMAIEGCMDCLDPVTPSLWHYLYYG